MQASLALTALLVAYGNRWLAGDACAEFFPANPVFAYCESVLFRDLREVAGTSLHAADPIAWFDRLREEGGVRLHMGRLSAEPASSALPEHMLAAFAGGSPWCIGVSDTTAKGDDCARWASRWELGDRRRADRRIWRVSYGRLDDGVLSAGLLADKEEDPAALKRSLAHVLDGIAGFAERQKIDNFARIFRHARETLDGEPVRPGRRVGLPPDASRLARQLYAAADAASVFGGMGSWNDLGFEGRDQEEYERRSAALFRLLGIAVATAANIA